MTPEDTGLQSARAKIFTASMIHDFAVYEHELALRKSWDRGVEEFFNDHPSISEFCWQQYSQREGGFCCDPNKVQVDGMDEKMAEGDAYAAYKDAVELLAFFKASELRQLFGNFVEVTVRRDGLVYLATAEEV